MIRCGGISPFMPHKARDATPSAGTIASLRRVLKETLIQHIVFSCNLLKNSVSIYIQDCLPAPRARALHDATSIKGPAFNIL
ncbi:unnamed protein product, partial [Brenthis ino]